MALHLIKLCVGIGSLAELETYFDARRRDAARAGRDLSMVRHQTRMFPKRSEELLAGGSLYWVIAQKIQARQRILQLDDLTDETGRKFCSLGLDFELVPTQQVQRRPFQGWRYLEPQDAPADLGGLGSDLANAELEEALKAALSW